MDQGFDQKTDQVSWGTPGYIHKELTMEILKFEGFLNEQVKEQDVMVNDYINKPNLKDPKTDKDFIELITKY